MLYVCFGSDPFPHKRKKIIGASVFNTQSNEPA